MRLTESQYEPAGRLGSTHGVGSGTACPFQKTCAPGGSLTTFTLAISRGPSSNIESTAIATSDTPNKNAISAVAGLALRRAPFGGGRYSVTSSSSRATFEGFDATF